MNESINTPVNTTVHTVTISADMAGQRIDNFLLQYLKGVPKSLIYRIVRKGEVRVNKKRIKAEYKIQADDLVRIPPIKREAKASPHVNPKLAQVARLEGAIVFEDERILAVNKPTGLAVHGGSGLQFGMIEGLRALRPQQDFLELVHRIDRDTSGLILVAKKRSALRHLHEQLRDKKMQKRYHALVTGQWPQHRHKVKAPLYKNTLQSGERMVQVRDDGKPSETRYRVLQSFADATLIEASPITGRTHQIRVHCQYAGHAIIGDAKYCDSEINADFAHRGCPRLFLHAAALAFIHPGTKEPMRLMAKYDDTLKHILNVLEAS
jgi:23S rRNA pseudouridine955/2504/2580 synthase